MEFFSVRIFLYSKIRTGKTPYLDTFHAVPSNVDWDHVRIPETIFRRLKVRNADKDKGIRMTGLGTFIVNFEHIQHINAVFLFVALKI